MNRTLIESDSRYDYTFCTHRLPAFPEVLAIRDLCGNGPFRSVTNGMAQVMREIEAAEGKSLAGAPIIYADSCGIWDGIAYTSGGILPYHLGFPGQILREEEQARDWVLKFPELWQEKEVAAQ